MGWSRVGHGGIDPRRRIQNHTGRSGSRGSSSFVMYHNGRSHILHVSVSTEKAGGQLGYHSGGGLLTKARRVDIPGFLIEGLGCSSTFVGNPGIVHGTFHVVLVVLQLAKIMIDPLWGANLPLTPLQLVQRDGDALGLPAPVSLGPDGAERAGELSGDPPRSRVRDGQLPVSGGLGGEQPHLLSWLNGVLLIPVSAAGMLESVSELDLHCSVSAKLVVLESTNVGVGG